MLIRCHLLTIMLVILAPAGASAHYHILLPDRPATTTGKPVTITYQFGHPFEHQLFDTQPPRQLYVLAPDGCKIDLLAGLEKFSCDGAEGKPVAAFRARFTPQKRGDHIVVAETAPVTVEGEKQPLRDLVKVIVHVQTQNGWDRAVGATGLPEPLPLTRPYGLVPGMAFRAEFTAGEKTGQPLAGILVEMERYNATTPKELPRDEQITRTARTDRVGTATVTPTESGWWAITGVRDKEVTRQRGTLWFYVEGK